MMIGDELAHARALLLATYNEKPRVLQTHRQAATRVRAYFCAQNCTMNADAKVAICVVLRPPNCTRATQLICRVNRRLALILSLSPRCTFILLQWRFQLDSSLCRKLVASRCECARMLLDFIQLRAPSPESCARVRRLFRFEKKFGNVRADACRFFVGGERRGDDNR